MVSGDYESSNYVRFRDASLDIEDAPAPESLSVYPNPATDLIRVNSKKPWTITDMAGRTVLNGTSNRIDVSSLPQGQYSISEAGQTSTTPFIVRR